MSIEIKDKRIAEIDGEEYDVLYSFQLAIPGWECDSNAHIVDYQGEPRLLMSDHGTFEVISKDEQQIYSLSQEKEIPVRKDVSQLEEYIDSYRMLIEDTEKAIEYLV